jgi:hypothetical protein
MILKHAKNVKNAPERSSMKVCLCLMVFLGTSSLLAQTESQNADQREITALEQQIVQLDLKGIESPQFDQDHLGRDVIGVWPMGFWGWDEATKPDPRPPLEEKVDNLKFRFYGNTAIVDGTAFKKDRDPSNPANIKEWHGFLVHVWVKRDGKWQLVSVANGPLAPGADLKPLG